MKKQLRMSGMSRKQLFLLFGFFLISTLSVSAQKYFELHDAYNNRSALIPDVLYYNETYHEYANGRLGAQWKFELVADSFYTITDRKHGKVLATNPNVDDTQTYHYDVNNGDHAQWCLVDVDGRGVLFLLKNKKYNKKFLACWSVGNGNGELLIQDTIGAVKKKCASWRLIEKYGTGNMPKDVKGREVKATSELVYNTNNNTTVSMYNLPRTLCGDVLGNQLIQGLPGSPPNDMTFMNSIPREKYGAMDQTREGTQSGKDYLISIYVNSPNRIDHTNNYVDLIDPTNNNWAGEKTRDSLKLVRRGDAYIVNYGWKGFYLGEYKLNTLSKDFDVPFGTTSLLSRFFIQEQNINNGTPLNNTRLQIPFQVSGIVDHEVPILGTTVDPQIPYLVLHDPPGDASYSTFEMSKEICRQFEDMYTVDESNDINASVKFGSAGSVGLIATVDYEFSVTLSGGVTSGSLTNKISAQQNCITTSNSFSTSDLEPTGAGGSDIFIGYGTDLHYGKFSTVEFDYDNCLPKVVDKLIYLPTGTPRRFTYTEDGIRADIETLEAIVEDSTSNDIRTISNANNQIKVWNQVLALNEENKANATELLDQVSFSPGANDHSESSITVMETKSLVVDHWIQNRIGLETVIEVGGSGGSFGYEYSTEKRYGQTTTVDTSFTKMVSFDFIDNTAGDKFNVDVYRDPMFGTPVFKVLNSSKTSCPYEGGYQRDQPRLKIAGQDESEIMYHNLPVGPPKEILVDLWNDSNEPRSYVIQHTEGFSGTAEIKIGSKSITGGDTYKTLEIPANGRIQQVLSISSQSVAAYPNLTITMYPECDPALTSDINVSAYFGTTAVLEQSPVTLLSVFPNPTNGELIADFTLEESADVRFELYDMVGSRTILASEENFAAGPHRNEMNVEQVPSGIYQLAIKTNKSVISRKVIVQH